MIHNKQLAATILGSIAISGFAFAGDITLPATEESNNGNWFDNFGTIYSNDDNPYIQKFRFYGRFQAQYGYIRGEDVNGDDFSEDVEEIRRTRLGAEIKFLNGFKLTGNVNLVDDDALSDGGREFDYQDFDQLKLSYTTKDFLGFDKASLTYGRHKVAVGQEARLSSKKIKTVERAAISNRLFNGRWTGFSVDLQRNNWNGTLGYFSQDQTDVLGSLDQGSAVYFSSTHKLSHGNVLFDAFWNIDTDDDSELATYEWATTLGYETTIGDWDFVADLAFGDNGDDALAGADRAGNFWGVTLTGSRYIIEDKLEFVARYAYQGSEEDEGIRTNSRLFRSETILDNDVNDGRGDSHHSLYAGLNYYFYGDKSKVLVGIEYDNLDTPEGSADATTLWAAYRFYF